MSKLNLNKITLVCIDCVDIKGAINAIQKCMDVADFYDVKFFCNVPYFQDGIKHVKIDKIKSSEEYSEFIIRQLNSHIFSEYCLIIQSDGFIYNPKSWADEFYEYDYIGAPWWYSSGDKPGKFNVGNGGFSLRSKKILELCENYKFEELHPEDDIICRLHGIELKKLGVKFAPEDIAKRFSWEPNFKSREYTNSFGFHGKGVYEHLIQKYGITGNLLKN